MPLMKWARPYAARYARGKPKTAGDSRARRALRLAGPYGPAITGREARSRQRRRLSCREGGGVPIRLVALNTGRGHCRARIFASTAPRTERPGRGADRGYSFVSMSHHTARGKARPVMG